MKVKLTVDEQIEHMKNKGIKFNITSEGEAKEFLSNNNYYFKLKAYAKNYEQYLTGTKAGQYINLEFAYLQELSTLDMYFRKIILKITLDIEHFLKVKLLKDFSENDKEDGYNIVNIFFNKYPYIKKSIENKKEYSACADIIKKVENYEKMPVWSLVEILSFGDFIRLYKLYYHNYQFQNNSENQKIINCLLSIKFLRNAAAHNNCLINTLRKPYKIDGFKPNKNINILVSKIPGISRESRKNKMSNPVIHDFVVTLYAFKMVVSKSQIYKFLMEELKALVDERCLKHKEYFKDNQVISSYYKFVKKIVDYLYYEIVE